MAKQDVTSRSSRRRRRAVDLYRNPILLIIIGSLLPTLLLFTISYHQSISYAENNLASIVAVATSETNRLLEDADTILHRINTDLKKADPQTTVNLLQRQIYNDFRFREAGIFNSQGLLTLTSLGVVDPPIPISSVKKNSFDPNNPNLQILGPGRTTLMQELSVSLVLRSSDPVGGVYLLMNPVILTYF
jgi:hypothetical protein